MRRGLPGREALAACPAPRLVQQASWSFNSSLFINNTQCVVCFVRCWLVCVVLCFFLIKCICSGFGKEIFLW